MNLGDGKVLADVLTSAGSWNSEQPLLTYTVPTELQDRLCAGQLVAVPYGERLVEGIVWDSQLDDETWYTEGQITSLRPISAILDPEPALLPHQRALAGWMAEYYVTPLAHIALMMLPHGLMQRSQIVLHLVKSEQGETGELQQPEAVSLRLQALIGLLLTEGELDIEQLKQMLGPKRAREVLKEALASGLIEREAQLSAPRAKKRIKRVVRLVARGEALEAWLVRTEARLQQSLPEHVAINMAPDNVRRRPKKGLPDPWALPGVPDALTLTPQDHLLAQRQLAVINLLQNGASEPGNGSYWVPSKLCKASKLTPSQLQALVRENIIAIEEVEVQRDTLSGLPIAASAPLALTPDQKEALEHILENLAPTRGATTFPGDGQRENVVAPLVGARSTSPILLHGVTGSGKTEVYLQALAAIIARGKRGIVLVHEIVLTTQAILRFAGR